MSIGSSFAKSTLWSLAGNASVQLSSVAVVGVLARVLDVTDFGLVALAIVFVDIAQVITAGGVPQYLIRSDRWDPRVASTTFWINLVAACLLAIVIAGIVAPLAEAFYAPGTGLITAGAALILVVDAARGVHDAKLRRDFDFRAVALRDLGGNLLGGAVGIWLAFAGFGPWALLASRGVNSLLRTMATWRAARWAPSLVFDAASARTVAGFGVSVVGAQLLTVAGNRTPDLLIGAVLGPAALGYWQIAARALALLHQLTIAPLHGAALPALARVAESGRALAAYAKLTRATAYVATPVFLGFSALASDVVRLLFGDGWGQSAEMLRYLPLVVVAANLNFYVEPMLLAFGDSRAMVRFNGLKYACVVLATGVSLPFGLLAIAVAQAVRPYLAAPFGLSLVAKALGTTASAMVRPVVPAMLAGMGMYAVVSLVDALLRNAAVGDAWRLCLTISAGAATYVGLVFAIDGRNAWETVDSLRAALTKKLGRGQEQPLTAELR